MVFLIKNKQAIKTNQLIKNIDNIKTITIKTVQGVGDVFWVYQKLSPYFDKINFIICVINLDCPVQKRVLPFLKLLPKVDNFKLELVTSEYYDSLAKQKKQ